MKKLIIISTLFLSRLCFSQIDINNGLVLYMPFDNSLTDLSGQYNAVSTSVGVRFANDRIGLPNSCFSLSGQSFISIKTNTGLNLTDNISVSFWGKFSNDNGSLLVKGDNTTNEYGVCFSGSFAQSGQNKMDFRKQGIVNAPSPTNMISINTWTHYVITYSFPNVSFYRNGSLFGTGSINQTLNSSNTELCIGTYANVLNQPALIVTGLLDDLRIYNRILNSSEILLLGNAYVLNQLNTSTCINILPSTLTGTTFIDNIINDGSSNANAHNFNTQSIGFNNGPSVVNGGNEAVYFLFNGTTTSPTGANAFTYLPSTNELKLQLNTPNATTYAGAFTAPGINGNVFDSRYWLDIGFSGFAWDRRAVLNLSVRPIMDIEIENAGNTDLGVAFEYTYGIGDALSTFSIPNSDTHVVPANTDKVVSGIVPSIINLNSVSGVRIRFTNSTSIVNIKSIKLGHRDLTDSEVLSMIPIVTITSTITVTSPPVTVTSSPITVTSLNTITVSGTCPPNVTITSVITVNSCNTLPGNSTGLKMDEFSNEINIYPNPSSGKFEIASNVNIDKIEVYDGTGKLIYTIGNTDSIDLSNQPKGLYYIKLYKEGTLLKSQKIVIQ